MNLLYKVYFGLLLITLASYITIAVRNNAQYIKMVILLMILWLLTSTTAIFLSNYVGWKNNLFIFHISTPLEYVILCLLYRDAIDNTGIKRMICISIPLYIVVCILFSLFVQKPDADNSYVVIIESVMLIFISLFFLREILLLQQVPVLHRFPMFWICVGILFYYTGNLIIEGMLNYMINHSMKLALRTYRLGYIFKYLLFVLFIIGAVYSRYSARIKNV